MSAPGPFRSIVEKLFEESLASSKYVKKILDNMVLIALETKKIAEVMTEMNERLNQHEDAILKIIELQQQKNQSDVVEQVFIKNKEEPSKPN